MRRRWLAALAVAFASLLALPAVASSQAWPEIPATATPPPPSTPVGTECHVAPCPEQPATQQPPPPEPIPSPVVNGQYHHTDNHGVKWYTPNAPPPWPACLRYYDGEVFCPQLNEFAPSNQPLPEVVKNSLSRGNAEEMLVNRTDLREVVGQALSIPPQWFAWVGSSNTREIDPYGGRQGWRTAAFLYYFPYACLAVANVWGANYSPINITRLERLHNVYCYNYTSSRTLVTVEANAATVKVTSAASAIWGSVRLSPDFPLRTVTKVKITPSPLPVAQG